MLETKTANPSQILRHLCYLLPISIILLLMTLWFSLNFHPLRGRWATSDHDCGAYVRIASDLRKFQLRPAGNGAYEPVWQTFHPGFPLSIALLPLPVTPTSGAIASFLAAVASVVLLYLYLARHSYWGALAAAALWAFLLAKSKLPLYPWSEPLFFALLVGLFLAASPKAKGLLLGLLVLVRPEAYLLLPGTLAFTRGRRNLILLLIVFMLTISPYLLLLHNLTGRWSLTTPGKVKGWQVAPYITSGVGWAQLRAWREAGRKAPEPGSLELAREVGIAKSSLTWQMTNPLSRFKSNLLILWRAVGASFKLPLLLGLIGFVVLLASRRRMLLQPVLTAIPAAIPCLFYTPDFRLFMLWLFVAVIAFGSGFAALHHQPMITACEYDLTGV